MTTLALETFLRNNATAQTKGINETMSSFFTLTPSAAERAAPKTESKEAPKKTVACKEIFVARYGKIYKRKAPSPTNCIKLQCAPGFRYCKLCDTHKPLSAFYTAVKRYVCRKCHKNRVRIRLRERIAADTSEAKSMIRWYRLSVDRIWFGIPKIQFDSTTIKDIINYAEIPWSIEPMPCPIDPMIPMRPRNVAVLSSCSYSLLMRLWKHSCSRAMYISFVQRTNLIPPKFDVAFPCDAYSNKNYLRPIIDVGPIFLSEQQNLPGFVDGGAHDSVLISNGHSLDDPVPAEYVQKYTRVIDNMLNT